MGDIQSPAVFLYGLDPSEEHLLLDPAPASEVIALLAEPVPAARPLFLHQPVNDQAIALEKGHEIPRAQGMQSRGTHGHIIPGFEQRGHAGSRDCYPDNRFPFLPACKYESCMAFSM